MKSYYFTCGAGTAYLSGSPEFTLGFSEVCVAQYFVFCVMLCRSIFFLLVIVLSVLLRFTASDFPFDMSSSFFAYGFNVRIGCISSNGVRKNNIDI